MVMPAVPEPRCFAATTTDPLSQLAARTAHAADATQRHALLEQLKRDLRAALSSGRDDLLRRSLATVASPSAGLVLVEALDQVINSPADSQSDIAARLFAMPVVLVAAGLASGEISGAVSDVRTISRLLESHEVLGSARAFRLYPALSSENSLESDSPSRWYALLRGIECGHPETAFGIPPAPIALESADESVHLRFLLGSVVAAVQALTFRDAAASIGKWGMPVGRELLAQLQRSGLSLLPLPRPPAGLMQALHEGRRAREEVALQAFASRVLRRMRTESGEPGAEVAALESGSIGVRLLPGFAGDPPEAHFWKLDQLDDLADVTNSVLDLLADCRVSSVRVLERVVSDAEFLGG